MLRVVTSNSEKEKRIHSDYSVLILAKELLIMERKEIKEIKGKST